MRRSLVAIVGSFLAFSGVAQAGVEGPLVDTSHVTARLVASVDAAAPGDTVTLGIAKEIIPHWHTYWRNPGDSGLATTAQWEVPPGVEVGALEWPAPERYSFGPVTNYGYEGEVTLLAPLTVPTNAEVGSALTIRAEVSWLVCENVCIPEEVELALELPIAAASEGNIHPAIEAAQARLPQVAPWPARHALHDDNVRLAVDVGALPEETSDVWFYPFDWGRINHSEPQVVSSTDEGVVVEAPRGQAAVDNAPLDGVLVVRAQTPDGVLSSAFELTAPKVDGVMTGAPMNLAAERIPAASTSAGIGWVTALAFALLGGLILNLMPCVFPVLAMKALALVRYGGNERAQVRVHGLAYLAGVLASFLVLAAVVLALQQGGTRLGWGFQFQSSVFVVLVAWLLFAVGLNLSGVFAIGGGLAGVGQDLTERGGLRGSFFTGVLAAVVATPCTAPFMGAAIGFAMTQSPLALVTIFLSLGLGLALPFVVLAWWPALIERLPRPGPWMERFKQFLAFPMYGAAIWLVWVLALQAGAEGVLVALSGMLALALAAWLYHSTWGSAGRVRRCGLLAATVLVVATLAVGIGITPRTEMPARTDGGQGATLAHEAWSSERLAELRAEGPVFVNFTAAWCITCLVNERVALDRREVAQTFAERNVAYLKGDWTNQDAEIAAELARFGRSGVPLYLYYPPGEEAVVLPQILTLDTVLNTVTESSLMTDRPQGDS
ncbi:MAG TPA: protein-disulfide reductase DsbD domain-containing protein [Azoarcus sp.]|nr:protein-disulfide reductase DsbD domain-containing protein [Azoarcus sp.]